MFRNKIIKNILSAVAVAGGGFVLLNLAFLFSFFLNRLVIWCVQPFLSVGPEMNYYWFPPLTHLLFAAVIGLISWFVFRTKLRVLYKAIYLTVPLAVVFVTLGMFLYRWPVAAYSSGTLFGIGVLFYLYRTKQPWLYFYTVILVGLVLAIFTLSGGEI